MTALQELEKRFARAIRIDEAASWLHWDQSVTMPKGGILDRSEQLAVLAEASHAIISNPEIGDLLATASVRDDVWYQANFREMQRMHTAATAVSPELVTALAHAKAKSETAWRLARNENDFNVVLPAFEPLVNLVREEAAALGDAKALSPYDALLDQYDPGRKANEIETIFDRLSQFLAEIIPEIIEKQGKWPSEPAIRADVTDQRKMGIRLLKTIGFDFEHGRMDESIHPFSTGTIEDARITARWDKDDALSGLMAVLHEAGHAAYTRGQPKVWRNQPVGAAAGMTMHESQSLTFEMQAGRSREMSSFLSGILNEAGYRTSADYVRRALQFVQPSYVRVEADEVTYPIHIILRFELEQGLISGDLQPKDLKTAWNDHLETHLGLPGPDDLEGCLQDIHWFDGAFGYFPTYTLGALTAAQLFQTAEKEIGKEKLATELGNGDYGSLQDFMAREIHSQGCLHASSNDLIAAVTGRPLSTDAFETHIKHRYLD